MKKISILGICIIALVALAAWAPNADAFETYQSFDPNNPANPGPGDNCANCHPGFDAGFGGPLHGLHLGAGIGANPCTLCHTNSGGTRPVYTMPAPVAEGNNNQGCRGCHGVDNGTGDGIPNFNFDDQWATGLRTYHENPNGAGNPVGTCSGCHSTDVPPLAETTVPVYYELASVNVGDPCADNLDNDGNGVRDNNDEACAPPPVEICDNGIDDTGNGLTDCEDPTCDGFVGDPTTCGIGECAATGNLVCQGGAEVDTCMPGQPGQEGPAGDPTCEDLLDNDCNGQTDIDDPACQVVAEEICDNGVDDNGNGLVDCEDPQCEGFVDGPCDTGQAGICAAGTFECQSLQQVCVQNEPPGTEGPVGDPSCEDGLDNDCNGMTDAADSACQEVVEEICDNGIDDNGNELIDCEDPACDGFVDGPCDTGLEGICADGTYVCQMLQQFCVQNEQPATEGPFGDPTCDDGLDNDCNGFTDADDPNCQAMVGKVTICHIPPGNPDKAKTKSISAMSVDDHLGHGDTLGPCNE